MIIDISNSSLDDETLEYLVILEKNNAYSDTWTKKEFNYWRNYGDIYIAKSNNIIVGFAIVGIYDSKREICNILVDRSVHNRGIGSTLIDKIKKDYSSEKILIHVNINDTRAIGFYEKNGFVEIKKNKNFYREDDALVMSCPSFNLGE